MNSTKERIVRGTETFATGIYIYTTTDEKGSVSINNGWPNNK
jgi:hypothetical protein